MANRLAASTSPYLLQHRDNPVDWWPWSPEALAEARRRDVPVLLSVGYAACHWCHVMAHESFEDATVADRMNADFVCVKVDREERPDVDAVYMEATQAMTGQGGWPMTCFLTPDGAPFFCGTYFPQQHFLALLDAVTTAWRERRTELVESGAQIVSALGGDGPRPDSGAPTADELDAATSALARSFDAERGGFGRAPKFPPAMVLEFLLRHHERTGSPQSLNMVDVTAEAMARGGMYDQLAGGFARYSVDADWVVPHFEKMLYDNALLLRLYLHHLRRTGSALAERIARETADFLLRDLRTPEHGFASALDADTDGVEGLTYAWTPAELLAALGHDNASWAADLLSVTAAGTFEHGASTLQLRQDPDDDDRWESVRSTLLAVRDARPQPGRDDKVVTAWNGFTIAALAEAAVLLERPDLLDAAVACARLLLDLHLVDGRLVRTSRDGRPGTSAGVADDYGGLAEGLLVLHQATGEGRWLVAADQLLDAALAHFVDAEGRFHDTADDAETLVRRPWDPTDNATPSGQSSLAAALLTYSALTGSIRHRQVAEQALGIVGSIGVDHPRHLGWALAAAEGLLAGPLQIAVVGEPGGGPLTATAWRRRGPGAVVVSGPPDALGVPLLADRPLLGGSTAAYVCRGMVCDRPVTTVADLEKLLA
ncbi:MAG: thioredoxin domain-containing protein [bacterium]